MSLIGTIRRRKVKTILVSANCLALGIIFIWVVFFQGKMSDMQGAFTHMKIKASRFVHNYNDLFGYSHTSSSNVSWKAAKMDDAKVDGVKTDDVKTDGVEANTTPIHACRFVMVDAFDPKIMKMVQYFPPLNCKGRSPVSLVYLDGYSTLRVNWTKAKLHGKDKDLSYCRYRAIFKNTTTDYAVYYGGWSEKFTETVQLTDSDEYVMTICYDKSDKNISRTYIARVVWDEEKDKISYANGYAKHLGKFSPKHKFNVMMLGLDGMARLNFVRQMPKTRNFILNEMDAIELVKFNKVAWSTIMNLTPLFTGISFPGILKFWREKKDPYDIINHKFVWTDYEKAGYRTALDMEEGKITGFHCIRKGFHKNPVHMYTRPLSLGVEVDQVMNQDKGTCMGDTIGTELHNDWILRLAERYNNSQTPYLAISFRTKLSHDNLNHASAGDDMYLEFFRKIKKANTLHNTIFILFADHGEVYGPIRRTFNGIIESKTPLAYFIVPSWLKTKFPDVHKTLTTNAQGLTSHMDLYATLKDIVYFQSPNRPDDLYTGPGTSLFQKIPVTRLCAEAGIPVTFCNCNSMKNAEVGENDKKYLASFVVSEINKLLNKETECDQLSVKQILNVMSIESTKDIHKSYHHRTAVLYQVNVMTTPGDAAFEANVEWNKPQKTTLILGMIGRINMYRGQKDCVKDKNKRIYCYCSEN